jgi:hypothetical protein
MKKIDELYHGESTETRYQRWMQELLNGEMPGGILKDLEFMECLYNQAAQTGNLEVVKHIIENKYCAANAKWALTDAAFYGHVDVVNYLIPNCSESNIKIAYKHAIENGHFEVTKTLLKIITEYPDYSIDSTVLTTAFKNKYFDIILLLTTLPGAKEAILKMQEKDTIFCVISQEKSDKIREMMLQIVAFIKNSQGHLKRLTNYVNNSCLFFSRLLKEEISKDAKHYCFKIGLAEIAQKWGISDKQLQNIYSIRESILVEIDEPENTVSPK